jgi:hypothetical protein
MMKSPQTMKKKKTQTTAITGCRVAWSMYCKNQQQLAYQPRAFSSSWLGGHWAKSNAPTGEHPRPRNPLKCTTSGQILGQILGSVPGLRLAKNSSSAYDEGLVLTVAYGPSPGYGLARAGNPYFPLSYNVGSREWSVHTRIVIPDSSVDYEQPQILSCDGRIFLVTLYVCPTREGAGAPVAAAEGAAPTAAAAGAADEAPAAGAADGFSHQLVIH